VKRSNTCTEDRPRSPPAADVDFGIDAVDEIAPRLGENAAGL
jgi:hypothetical protein